MNTKFTLDQTPYYEAILFPNGQRALFLVHGGHGMHSDTVRLAEKVVELLNAMDPKEQLKICPYHLEIDPKKLSSG